METLQNIFSEAIVERLGWTLVHFVWQGTAVAMILAMLLKLLHKTSANMRYIISCMALALIVLMPVITIRMIDVSAVTAVPAEANLIELPRTDMSAQAVLEMPQIELPPAQAVVASREALKDRFVEAIEPALPYIVAGWLIGVFGLSLWHLGGWAQLQRLRRTMVKPVSEKLVITMNKLAEVIGVKKVVCLMESALVQGPMVVGWLKPVILLPASALTGLEPEQLEAILAHELAHVKRCDYLVNIIQTAVEIVGFYNPAIWWVSAKIRTERENCCDDLAVSVTGDKVIYARALTTMEEVRCGYKLAVAGSGGSLFDRVKRLLGKDGDISGEKSLLTAAAAVLLLVLVAIPAGFAVSSKAGTNGNSISKTESGDYKVTLDGGVTVELVGVCDYPGDRPRSWRPDGTEPEKKLYVKRERDYSDGQYGFILKVDGPNDLSFAWEAIKGTGGLWSSCKVLDDQGGVVEGFEAAIIRKHDGKEAATDIRVGIATGPWDKVASHDGKSMCMTQGIAFATAYESDGAVRIVVTDGLGNEVVQRIIAIDENGNIHTISSGSVSNQNLRQTTAIFPGLNLKQIKEFQFQTRPYKWVEFKDVSLKP
ncbi:MAG TPA: M56 family metallopeptidase, partial [Sedimentisphaerales bacterium]|nr:M56 family metallopeptidase [Sedimentisphaerales bacterium]